MSLRQRIVCFCWGVLGPPARRTVSHCLCNITVSTLTAWGERGHRPRSKDSLSLATYPTELACCGPWPLTSTLHWQSEPMPGREGLCTLSLAKSHTTWNEKRWLVTCRTRHLSPGLSRAFLRSSSYFSSCLLTQVGAE